MNPRFQRTRLLLGTMLFGIACSVAHAGCGSLQPPAAPGLQPQSWQEYAPPISRSLMPVAGEEAPFGRDQDRPGRAEPIVGFWRVVMVAKGNSPAIPDGTVVDRGFAQWHADGTEITNSSRKPITGNFCLGTWKKVGASAYRLNHFGMSWDDSGINFVGLANIRENVVVNAKGTAFSGTWSIEQYDTAGNLLVHLQGVIAGQRIGIDTQVKDLI